MKLVLYTYIYASAGCKIKAPQVLEYSYGEFLLRKRNGSAIRYLNALEDNAYGEVKKIVRENFSDDKFELTDLVQIAFGPAACDADTDGKPFEMNLWPYCENCKNEQPSSWQMTDPPEFVEMNIPSVEHYLWNSLNLDQRKTRVLDCLRSFGIDFF